MNSNERRIPSNHAASKASRLVDQANIEEQKRSMSYLKNGKQTASNSERAIRGKNDHRYWLSRVFRPVSGRGEVGPHYCVKIQWRGRRVAFSLSTCNKDAAARRALALYGEIVARGLDAVLAERRAKSADDEAPPPAATIGAWIDAAERVFDGKPATFGSYIRALRLIAAEIIAVKKSKKRFGRTQAKAYRREIDAAPLSILTASAIQAWRLAYVRRVGENPAKQRAARITANFTLRSAKALFSRKMVKFAGESVVLPEPVPFAGVEFYKRESMRYQSKIDHVALLRAAARELADDPSVFKALILALGAGLRRHEIDRLLWRQVDSQRGVIHVETTDAGGLKSADSTGNVPIDETLASVLQGFKAKARSSVYVLEEGDASPASSKSWGRHYRCQEVFDRLTLWLRKHGVESRAPIHTLRKEAGSIVATQSGLLAASRFLRHADVQVTAMHYADHKERVTVDMTALASPDAANVEAFATEAKNIFATPRGASRGRK
jgi:integrase